jgi:hypothetical protein
VAVRPKAKGSVGQAFWMELSLEEGLLALQTRVESVNSRELAIVPKR